MADPKYGLLYRVQTVVLILVFLSCAGLISYGSITNTDQKCVRYAHD